ncbi:TetR/AcrR family transcriptional regulator [Dactylosporangium matsuzakiense]|uniref:TetR family transcriptional regulator n=1 Tax=Dactylosporangium matsuzakiense TaxID=53360 RepID=A0A9W6KHR0_9ACTN|nr:TetR/AcrR family transcriptional regulator [Dactylosporangium matsuzakiense]UWZ41110.1 TetR/AcrR family transcriptional regulator [Dactylosporangium matsuzakiense]GLL00990.1 TetR family transcriptional regulator [Dactylosporangium matsuzakiense]
MTSSATAGRPSEARDRLLGTASRIFYADGIRSVGVDRIVAEAQVTRATLYRHFPGKDDLILAYLAAADEAIRARTGAAVAVGLPGPETVRVISQGIAHTIRTDGFRGCAFLNAAAEYPDPDHPIHRAVLAHRQWFLDTVAGLLGDDARARHFVMLRDGAMAAGCLFDPVLISDTFLTAVDGFLCT